MLNRSTLAHLALIAGFLQLDSFQIRSESGAKTATIQPHSKDRFDGADYQVAECQDGKVIQCWRHSFEFTLRDAILTEEGYMYGWASVRNLTKVDASLALGDVHLVAISPQGSVLLDDKLVERRRGMWSAAPQCRGIVPFDNEECVVFRTTEDDDSEWIETWRTYRFGSSKPMAVFNPARDVGEGRIGLVIDARRLGHSGLIITHMQVLSEPRQRPWLHASSRFALFTVDGKGIWAFDLPDDLAASSKEEWEAHGGYVQLKKGLVDVLHDDRFQVRSNKTGRRITFSLERESKGVMVVKQIEEAKDSR